MSIKLDELRKRLLQQPRPDNGKTAPLAARTIASALPPPEAFKPQEPAPAKTPAAKLSNPGVPKAADRAIFREDNDDAPRREEAKPTGATAAPISLQVMPQGDHPDQYQIGAAVGKVFDQARPMQASFDELTRSLDQIGKIGESAELTFSPLKEFQGQLTQLAKSFQPMRAFQTHLAEMAQTFEPMKVLHDQLAQVGESFHGHVEELVKALDPVKDFRERIVALAQSFEQATELQAELGELYRSLHSATSNAALPKPNGLDKPAAIHR
jgi:hypothetical protein